MNIYNQIFKINWDHIFSEISKNTLFKSDSINNLFFSDWKELLCQIEVKFLKNPDVKVHPLQSYNLNFHILSESQPIDLSIPLLIPRLINELNKSKAPVSNVDLDTFGSRIPYCADFNLKKFNNDPIVILDEHILKKSFLVDGNHRVKYAKKHNISQLKAHIIQSPFLVNHPLCFSYHFHYAFYCFLLDYTFFNDSYARPSLLRHLPFYEKYYYRKHSLQYWVKKNSLVFEENPLLQLY